LSGNLSNCPDERSATVNFDLTDPKMSELRLLVWRLTNSSTLATDLKAVTGREEPDELVDSPEPSTILSPVRRVKGGG